MQKTIKQVFTDGEIKGDLENAKTFAIVILGNDGHCQQIVQGNRMHLVEVIEGLLQDTKKDILKALLGSLVGSDDKVSEMEAILKKKFEDSFEPDSTTKH